MIHVYMMYCMYSANVLQSYIEQLGIIQARLMW
jgi:hypothetical protein